MKIGIIFDLDGTLLDSLADLHHAVNHTLVQHGCPERSVDEIRRFLGEGAKLLIQRALPGKENDPPFEQVYEDYIAYYATVCARGTTRPYAGILEALEQLKDYPLAVVSNKPDASTKALCKDCFGDIFALGVSDDLPKKPAPDMVYAAMKALGVDKCVYVGDSETDVETAVNSGAPCLSVLWGFRDREELVAAGGKYFCDNTSDLPRMIRQVIEKEFY